MNERIRELAEQAGAVKVWEWASDDVLDTKNMDAEKFAQLIVGECAGIVQNYMSRWPEDCDLVIKIKEHFGVEE
jgi:hypothetical protein